jgi:hypothetical protein
MKIIGKLIRFTGAIALLYVAIYLMDSYMGGYYLRPEADGVKRYKLQYGGLALPLAVLWQPRYGHCALGRTDYLGYMFAPVIWLDRRFVHPTKYVDDNADWDWLQKLQEKDYHPEFRQRESGKHAH